MRCFEILEQLVLMRKVGTGDDCDPQGQSEYQQDGEEANVMPPQWGIGGGAPRRLDRIPFTRR
jgi:hypothetical protein